MVLQSFERILPISNRFEKFQKWIILGDFSKKLKIDVYFPLSAPIQRKPLSKAVEASVDRRGCAPSETMGSFRKLIESPLIAL